MTLSFPDGFVWGAATSGYQIEGAPSADGKGPSIWDTFVKVPGKILHGDTGDIACNVYDPKQLEVDLELMKRLGLKSFIFSVQWPRIQPDGTGGVNTKGLDYYRRLVDGLLARGIVPALTLYHWELPQALQDKGGWVNRDTVQRFVEYSTLLYDALAAEVPLWITQNEPHTTAWLGYNDGKHAPGLTDMKSALTAAHHLLLSHGAVVKTLRDRVANAETGFGAVLAITPVRPVHPDSVADRLAAKRFDGDQNRLFLDPMFRGEYPADVLEYRDAAAGGWKFIQEGDLATIHTPVDFLGVNYYTPTMIAAGPDGGPEWRPNRGPCDRDGLVHRPGGPARDLAASEDGVHGQPAAVRVRERGVVPGLPEPGGGLPGPGAGRFSAGASAGGAPGGRRGRAAQGVLRVVAAGQLRVGQRVPGAVRVDLCRLPHAEAGAENVVRVVQGGDRPQRGRRVRRKDNG